MPVVLVAEQALLMRDYLILTTNKTKGRRGVFCGKGLFMGIILPGA
jgi:3-hydroxymyristoyl/3-hydroxydecanoyl-(acyl carrier protein) dehydratase